jgi:hypothetical protein
MLVDNAVSLYTPKHPSPGHLIILATWTGASRSCIAQFATAYAKFSPDSKILLIESCTPEPFYPYFIQQAAIEPAVLVVRDTLDEVAYTARDQYAGTPSIIVHTFSGGGTDSITHLLDALQHVLNVPLPLSALILENISPNSGSFQNRNELMPTGLHFQNVESGLLGNLASVVIGEGEQEPDYCMARIDDDMAWGNALRHADLAAREGWDLSLFVKGVIMHQIGYKVREMLVRPRL